MKKTHTYVLCFLFVLLVAVFAAFWALKFKKSFIPAEKPVEVPVTLPEEPVKPPEIEWKPAASFQVLPGWNTTDLSASFKTFKVSCDIFFRQPATKEVGSKYFPLKAEDWYPACKAARKLSNPSNAEIKTFFTTWFDPGEFYEAGNAVEGLFTGYYVPLIDGSLKKTEEYTVPIYALPRNWVIIRLNDFDDNLPDRKLIGRVDGHHIYPFHTRAEINQGAIDEHAPVLVWLNDQVDRLFLEIQGSGLIKLTNGREMAIGYAGQNGAAYTSIASVLINRGVMTRHNASMQNIRAYFKEHPEKVQDVLNQNKSFVFFEKQGKAGARGAQGAYLTPGYSLAVDRAWVPMGAPVWLDTTKPDAKTKEQVPLQRLFIAQDTGGAIKGPVRGDVFWGNGEDAGAIAGRMKNKGRYWVMLPRKTPRTEADLR